jgi:hypothetical protein
VLLFLDFFAVDALGGGYLIPVQPSRARCIFTLIEVFYRVDPDHGAMARSRFDDDILFDESWLNDEDILMITIVPRRYFPPWAPTTEPSPSLSSAAYYGRFSSMSGTSSVPADAISTILAAIDAGRLDDVAHHRAAIAQAGQPWPVLPWGYVHNGLALLVAGAGVGSVFMAARVWWREHRIAARRRSGVCRCGYSVRGLTGGRCPECGAALDRAEPGSGDGTTFSA